jgi:restriction system protein
MTARRGFLAELQRERARVQLARQREYRATLQAQERARREYERARRSAEREAAATERERKRLYVEDRKEVAANMTAGLQARVAELRSVLEDGLRRTPLTVSSLKREVPPFDPVGLDVTIPQPEWVEPVPPGAVGRLFGGAGRYQRELAAAREENERRRAEYARMEEARLRQLEQRQRDHERVAEEVQGYNAEIDQFALDCAAREPEAVEQFIKLTLDGSVLPEGFPHLHRVIYRAESREAVIEFELPDRHVIPPEREYRYVQSRDSIEPLPRPVNEIKDLYISLVAQIALRTLHDLFSSSGEEVILALTFNGHVSTKDRGTGQPIHPCLIGVSVTREEFSKYVLADVDPVVCVKQRLGALVSPHPYELEPVRPIVNFDTLLAQYKFVEGMDAVAELDSRPDLLQMNPTEFEHLTRQLFEAMGMKGWNTVACKDDGVDAVVVSEDPVFGGLCVVQAKRYRSAVGVDAVRELAGVMEDKHATKGFLVTTSWVTREGHQFAERHGRIQFYECQQLVYQLKEHLGLDVLISLPKPPPSH